MPSLPRTAAIALAVLCTACAGAGSGQSPGTSPATELAAPTSSAPSATSVAADPLDGDWSTGSVPIDDIRTAMLSADLKPDAVEGWIEEQGSPSEFTFELRFDSPTFSHYEANPNMVMQLGETGTYEFDGNQLRLSIAGEGDVYVFDVTLAGQTLSLDLVDQTEQGTDENLATHRLYTIAFYTSAPFTWQP